VFPIILITCLELLLCGSEEEESFLLSPMHIQDAKFVCMQLHWMLKLFYSSLHVTQVVDGNCEML